MSLPITSKPRAVVAEGLMPFVLPGAAPLMHDHNDPAVVRDAYKGRLLRDVPPGRKSTLEEFAAFVKAEVQKLPVARAISFEEWLDSTSYNEVRKEELRKVHDALRGGRPSRAQCRRISSFVKREGYSAFKLARMINSRCDPFKAFSGPYFKAIEEVVYALPEFIKHTPVPDRPESIRRLRQAGLKYYQTDFTAFESHFVPKILSICECELYRHCLSWSKDADFICKVIMGENQMKTRSGVTVKVDGRRMSGDMCTSLGNGFTNLMLARFLATRQGTVLNGFVEGDDGLFATTANLSEELYAELGFTIKVDEVLDPCEASFCGMVFAESGQIVKDPYRTIVNFGWSTTCVGCGPSTRAALARAKALSMCYEVGQCPVLGAWARHVLKSTRGVVPRFEDDGYHTPPPEMKIPPFAPTMDTRELVFRKYGVSVEAQIEAERLIERGILDIQRYLEPLALDRTYLTVHEKESAYFDVWALPWSWARYVEPSG